MSRQSRFIFIGLALSVFLYPVYAWCQVYEVVFKKGWNLVSFPINPEKPQSDEIFKDIKDKIISVWAWDSSNHSWEVSLYPPDLNYIKQKGFEQLKDIHAGQGFWVNSKSEKDLKVSIQGEVPSDKTLILNKGWNLLGLKSKVKMKISDYIATKGPIISCWKWDPSQSTWMVYLPTASAEEGMAYINAKGFKLFGDIRDGEGFWLNCSNATELKEEGVPKVCTATSQGTVNVGGGEVQTFLAKGKKEQYSPLSVADLKISEKEGGNRVEVYSPYYTYNAKEVSGGEDAYLFTQKTDKNKVGVKTKKKLEAGEWDIECKESYEGLSSMTRPTPKVISSSDGSTTITITDMILKTDITTSVTPYRAPKYIPRVNEIAGDVGLNNVTVIGGADITVVNSYGEKTDSFKAGFCASVAPRSTRILGELSGEDIYKKYTSGEVNLYSLYFKNGKWNKLGSAKITEYIISKDNIVYVLSSDTSMKRLYNFLFVMVPKYTYLKGTISGVVQEETTGTPIKGALVYIKGSQNDIVSDENGKFSLKYAFPEESQSANIVLIVKKTEYEDKIVSLTVTKDSQDIIGQTIELKKILKVFQIKGKVTGKGKEGIENPIEGAIVDLYTPVVLDEVEIKDGKVSVGEDTEAIYTWKMPQKGVTLINNEKGKNSIDDSDYSTYMEGEEKQELLVKVDHINKDGKKFTEENTGYIINKNGVFEIEMLPKVVIPSVIKAKTDLSGNYTIENVPESLKGFLTMEAGAKGYKPSGLVELVGEGKDFALEEAPKVEPFTEDFEVTPKNWTVYPPSPGVVKWQLIDNPEQISVAPSLLNSILFMDRETIDVEGNITNISGNTATIEWDDGKSIERELYDCNKDGKWDMLLWDYSSYDAAKYMIYTKAYMGKLEDLAKGSTVYISYPDPSSEVHLPPAYSGVYCYWYGNKDNGVISDINENNSTEANSGMLISPVIDLTNFSYATLKFATWFEVESLDIAKGQFDQMEVGVTIVDEEDGPVEIKWENKHLELQAKHIYRLDLLNPKEEPPNIQLGFIPYSSGGVMAAPIWIEKEYNLNPFTGHKIRLIYRFATNDEKYNGFRGWAIDDVKILNEQPIESFYIGEYMGFHLQKETGGLKRE